MYKPHQIEKGTLVIDKIREYGFAILSCEPRFGKTGIFIYAAEQSTANTILVLTKKAAIPDIKKQLIFFEAKKKYTVTNYESVHKLPHGDYDAIILDESHAFLQTYPKPSQTLKKVKALTAGKPIIYVSGTFFSESYSQAYPLLSLSNWTPFSKYSTFYKWHKEFGIPCEIFLYGKSIKQYNLTQEGRIKKTLSPYMITGTRKEVGFTHEPEDKIHLIDLDSKTKARIECIKKDKAIDTPLIVADTPMGEVNAIYQLSGGGIYSEGEYVHLSSEKIDYIHQNFNITTTAVMCHYIEERLRLKKEFPNVYSSTSDAEGVDLSQYKDLVIYSQNFSTAKHSQRRARQANINREDPIVVHFLIAESPAIDQHIYQTVSQKNRNFTARVYSQDSLFD